MKTPIKYYGGKTNLLKHILPLIPEHKLYCETFCGGAAVYFAKPQSEVEVINDTNKELINFYKVVQNDFVSLEKEIRISLHARDLHRKASVVYENPDMFNEIKRAWAVWMLSTQSFSSIFDGGFGYSTASNSTTKAIRNKRNDFSEDLAIRLQDTQIEAIDAVRLIKARDRDFSFFYVDPPYVNSDCGHYDGYTWDDFEKLLTTLSEIKGKFLLSSYPSPMLKEFTKRFGWHTETVTQKVSVANSAKGDKPKKIKTEVLTYNYPKP